jgi:hypothetical protein
MGNTGWKLPMSGQQRQEWRRGTIEGVLDICGEGTAMLDHRGVSYKHDSIRSQPAGTYIL